MSSKLRAIESAVTTDANVSYRTGTGSGEWDNVEINLNIANAFNQNPPFVDRLLGYDVANARPFGRVMGLYLSKSW